MTKSIIAIFTLALATIAIQVKAQNAVAGGAQKVSLQLPNVVQISQFNGGTVTMPVTTANNLAQGIESPIYTVSINSTDGFNVKAQAINEYFAYNGTATTTPYMKVADVLEMKVVENKTTGNIASGYNQYQAIQGTNQTSVIDNGNRGADQMFAVQYKATTGYKYPGGTYTASIMYTVTQF